MKLWERFILEHGYGVHAVALARIVAMPVKEILRVRHNGAARKGKASAYPDLFAKFNGRAPSVDEWPAPWRAGRNQYVWLGPEITLLVRLVGRLGPEEIAGILTQRLRQVTGNQAAQRSRYAVLSKMNKIGLQTGDVVGGLTIKQAATEVGHRTLIDHAIRSRQLKVERVGRHWMIPHAAWQAFKAKRVFPPTGHVPLRDYRDRLGIRSDKLSEFARMGYVPTAVRCNPYGAGVRNTKWGSWYIRREIAEQMVADRRAGRPMPWHGKALPDNLKVTWRLWQERKHPARCETCRQLWGEHGPPRSFAEYQQRYPPLAHGAKRHLTRVWSEGLTPEQVAEQAHCPVSAVRRAILAGLLVATKYNRSWRITRTDATRWRARKCPTGTNTKSWLAIDTAVKRHGFTHQDLQARIDAGELETRQGVAGAARGVIYVGRHQVARLREQLGYSEEEAAARVGVTVPHLRRLLEGVNWRGAKGIPLATVQAVIKRHQSRAGATIAEAAEDIGESEAWVRRQIAEGAVKTKRAPWDGRRTYLPAPEIARLRQLARLQRAERAPVQPRDMGHDWLSASQAATEAGVSQGTLNRWALSHRQTSTGVRYHRAGVRQRARRYWDGEVRFRRAEPPVWLRSEQA